MAYGVLALARPTFDVPYAEEMAAKAFARIDEAGLKTVGPRGLLFDAAAAREAAEALKSQTLDGLLLLQVTFTDASMTLELAKAIDAPLAIWAFPEPRSGGRLRLNSFCGLNLASHALGRAGVPMAYLYQSPDMALPAGGVAPSRRALHRLREPSTEAASPRRIRRGPRPRSPASRAAASASSASIRPDSTPAASTRRNSARSPGSPSTGSRSATSSAAPPPLPPTLSRRGVARSRGSRGSARSIRRSSPSRSRCSRALPPQGREGLSAFAVRCWPEMFTEYGCAICGPMGMMNQAGTPAACEADVYGAVTALMLQEIAGAPSWLVDIVDMDAQENTSVFWHCGSAPEAMRDPDYPAEAQIHSNRRMPLLYQFPLKPGRITIARLSQANNAPHLMVAGGEVLQAPISFTGTSGVVRFDAPAERALQGLIGQGLRASRGDGLWRPSRRGGGAGAGARPAGAAARLTPSEGTP